VIAAAALAVALVGVTAVVAGAASLARGHRDRRWGRLVAVDDGQGVTLRSDRYRLAGRPDALRLRSGGPLVPVELKHRPAPGRGPYPSHLVQLGAYALLLEDLTGEAPRFGVLRYADRDVRVRFDRELRERVLSTLDEVRRPYDGRADPSLAKCRGCPWSPRCDASLARTRPT